jgi:hypothetical protein
MLALSFFVVTLVFRLGPGSNVNLVASLFMVAGLILFFRWGALKAKEARK